MVDETNPVSLEMNGAENPNGLASDLISAAMSAAASIPGCVLVVCAIVASRYHWRYLMRRIGIAGDTFKREVSPPIFLDMINNVKETTAFGAFVVQAVWALGDKEPRGVTAFGRAVGEPQGRISQILCGDRPPPLEKMDEWAAVLGVTGPRKELMLDLARAAHCKKPQFDLRKRFGEIVTQFHDWKLEMAELRAENARLKSRVAEIEDAYNASLKSRRKP